MVLTSQVSTYSLPSIYLLPSLYPYISRSVWHVTRSWLVFLGFEPCIRQLAVTITLALLANGSPGLADPSLAEHPQYPSPHRLGFHAVNDRIQDEWGNEMDVGCESVGLGGHMFAKPVDHRQHNSLSNGDQ